MHTYCIATMPIFLWLANVFLQLSCQAQRLCKESQREDVEGDAQERKASGRLGANERNAQNNGKDKLKHGDLCMIYIYIIHI